MPEECEEREVIVYHRWWQRRKHSWEQSDSFLKFTVGFDFSFPSSKWREFPLQFCIQNVLLTEIVVRAFRIIILSLPAKSELKVPGLGRTVVVSVFSLVQSVTIDLHRNCFYKMSICACMYVHAYNPQKHVGWSFGALWHHKWSLEERIVYTKHNKCILNSMLSCFTEKKKSA